MEEDIPLGWAESLQKLETMAISSVNPVVVGIDFVSMSRGCAAVNWALTTYPSVVALLYAKSYACNFSRWPEPRGT
jgi:hypothetical protein